jgi:hypothetical protein
MHSKLSDLWVLRYGLKPYCFVSAIALNRHARYSAGQFG